MSLVFAAITPHPPLLAPSVKPEKGEKLKKTRTAFAALAGALYAAHPETVIVFSAHAAAFENAFVMNVEPEIHLDFSELGDLKKNYPKFKTDVHLAHNIKGLADSAGIPLQLQNDPSLDHGTSIPLYHLLHKLAKVKALTMSFSLLPLKSHFDFGYLIKDAALHTNRRVAVIASGDASHCLSSDAPGGFAPEGKEFDDKIVEIVKSGNASGLLQLDEKLMAAAQECLGRSLAMFFGVIQRMNGDMKVLCYEHPFGVGYLTAEFELK